MKRIEEFYEDFIYKSRYSRWDYTKELMIERTAIPDEKNDAFNT